MSLVTLIWQVITISFPTTLQIFEMEEAFKPSLGCGMGLKWSNNRSPKIPLGIPLDQML